MSTNTHTRRVWIVLLAGACALLAGGPAATSGEATPPPGEIRFVGENAIVTANGSFHSWKISESQIDFSDLEHSTVTIEIDIASLDTGIERRDKHLRSEDFFEIERWPTATARVHSAQPDGQDEKGRERYTAKFELTIRDVTKTVAGSFVVVSDSPPTVEGRLEVDRTEWGIGKPKQRFNPMSIGNEIPIEFRAEIQ